MFDTQVENIFINEHLVSATGEQIKVFLMGLMYAEIGMDISDEDLALLEKYAPQVIEEEIEDEIIDPRWEMLKKLKN